MFFKECGTLKVTKKDIGLKPSQYFYEILLRNTIPTTHTTQSLTCHTMHMHAASILCQCACSFIIYIISNMLLVEGIVLQSGHRENIR